MFNVLQHFFTVRAIVNENKVLESLVKDKQNEIDAARKENDRLQDENNRLKAELQVAKEANRNRPIPYRR